MHSSSSWGCIPRSFNRNRNAATGMRRQFSHICSQCDSIFHTRDDLEVHFLTTHCNHDEQPRCPPYGVFSFDTAHVGHWQGAPHRLGAFRGIQGHNNSCYLDTSLMALFFANDTFDGSVMDNERVLDNAKLEYTRQYLRLQIVNNLRRRGFVPAMLVLEWRRMIDVFFAGGVDFDGHCEEQEASEFVKFFLEQYGDDSIQFSIESTEEHHKISTSGEAACGQVLMQLLPSKDASQKHVWTVEQLLNNTLESEKLHFTQLGRSLILQLPRYGKKVRVIESAVPSPTLYLTAHHRSDRTLKVCYDLRAVIVIGTSHFVAYLRVPENKESDMAKEERANGHRSCTYRWIYFDSMSDRVGDENIPTVVDVTEELQILEYPNADACVAAEASLPGRTHLTRIMGDMSMVFYTSTSSE